MGDITLNLQIGLHSERLSVEHTNLTLINVKKLVTAHIHQKFAEHGISRLVDRLLLFLHDYSSTNILQVISSGSDLYDGCTVEAVLSRQPAGDAGSVEVRPHSLGIHSYKSPTFCDFCGEMLFGMFKQVVSISQD